ncbi:MAG TPA: 3-hydroxyacyl-ACP dehydratase FabZ [Coxiellaceae bacterium]|nr:MAG: 3-hydroxyacyl-[acyl-carrier-protein] dehydratase FabZ [Gammaproteobacteria bacterium RIFCSPHIGHO2_12_FULL_36_30]HLB57013.1 3-hydroxyacyl-ACP dehydratase FabZ [Coxiellaceae bacterium]
MTDKNKIDYLEVKKYLPHRYPFLLVDTVDSYEINKWLKAIKNVTFNEPYFSGHFPSLPVMPGVLIVEALAQASGILMYRSFGRYPNPSDLDLFYLAGIDNARFKRKVVPGDQLLLHVEVLRARENLWKFKGEATVNGELACSAEFMNIKA